MDIVWVPIGELKSDPKNRNKHSKEQIERLVKLIQFQGWRWPIIVSKQDGLIKAGHGRLLAARKMGLKTVPVSYQDFLTEEQAKAFQVSDNEISRWAELDLPGLNEDIVGLGPDFDLELLGLENFTVDVADKLSEEIEPPEPTESSSQKSEEELEEIPEKIESISKSGNVFRIGSHRLYNGDCLEVLKRMPDNHVDSLITDPPAGIAFMGKEWDEDKGGSKEWVKWLNGVMKEALRVIKPGAHGLVWAIPRTSHWTATALEDAGFEIRDVITHLFGTGFPKSLDISKAIDKTAGAEREVIGSYKATGTARLPSIGAKTSAALDSYESEDKMLHYTAPSTPEAKQWQGWGTALKPASEHWILVRKPCSEDTVAKNVLKHGTGGINIDASRIQADWDNDPSMRGIGGFTKDRKDFRGGASDYSPADKSTWTPTQGRFPANLVLDEEVAAMLDEQSGILKSGELKGYITRGSSANGHLVGKTARLVEKSTADFGGASRFFYCAKPSKREKNEGCEELPEKIFAPSGGASAAADRGEEYRGEGGMNRTSMRTNFHPTVKSIKLMQYLITMITPPDGTILDCFGGSGTTLVAAHLRAFSTILIEQAPEYCDIIIARAEFVTGKKAEILNASG